MDELDEESIDTRFDSEFRCLPAIINNEMHVGTSYWQANQLKYFTR